MKIRKGFYLYSNKGKQCPYMGWFMAKDLDEIRTSIGFRGLPEKLILNEELELPFILWMKFSNFDINCIQLETL
jgi:hypothetical protein